MYSAWGCQLPVAMLSQVLHSRELPGRQHHGVHDADHADPRQGHVTLKQPGRGQRLRRDVPGADQDKVKIGGVARLFVAGGRFKRSSQHLDD
jgi:hypothetical protein